MWGSDLIRKGLFVVCLLLVAATVALWVASWTWSIDLYVRLSKSGNAVTVQQIGGRVEVSYSLLFPGSDWGHFSFVAYPIPIREFGRKGSSISYRDYLKSRPNFKWNVLTPPTLLNIGGMRARGFAFPHWLLVVIFAIYPIIFFIRGPYRRYRRRKKGLCLCCGYDLTRNVSGICPECGVTVGQSKSNNLNV